MEQADELLARLAGLHSPPVSQWPAVGWWILMALLIAAAATIIWLIQIYRRRLWVREARAELRALRAQSETVSAQEQLAGISTLVRRIMMKGFTRESVASLHGDDWLQALDAAAGHSQFSQRFAPILKQAIYQRTPEIDKSEMVALFDTTDQLIKTLRSRSHA